MVYDSGKDKNFISNEEYEQIKKLLEEFLKDILKVKKTFKRIKYASVPQQQDNWSCGFWMLDTLRRVISSTQTQFVNGHETELIVRRVRCELRRVLFQ